MANEVKHIRELAFAYNGADSETSAREIVFVVYPHWKTDPGPVSIYRFTEGIMNTLLKLTKEVPGRSKVANNKEAVLLRAYGRNSDIMINREMEVTTHILLAEWGLASPLLARFQNGLYAFQPGHVCNSQDLQKESIWQAVAARLGEWHARLPLPKMEASTSEQDESKPVSTRGTGRRFHHCRTIWTVMREWLDALPSNSEEEVLQQRRLQAEFEKCFLDLNGDEIEDSSCYIPGHCDLLSANIIVPPQDPSTETTHNQDSARNVHFIDFEYSVPCPPAFDLATHFSEWAGYDCDYDMLPTRITRQRFVEKYLEYYYRHEAELGKRRNLSVQQLLHDIDRYRGMPGLYWGAFALIQQQISEVVFDW